MTPSFRPHRFTDICTQVLVKRALCAKMNVPHWQTWINSLPTLEGPAVLERWEMRDAPARLQFLLNIRNRWVYILAVPRLRRKFGPRFKFRIVPDPNPNSRNRSPICEAPRKKAGISPRIHNTWESFGKMSSRQKHTRPEMRTRSSSRRSWIHCPRRGPCSSRLGR